MWQARALVASVPIASAFVCRRPASHCDVPSSVAARHDTSKGQRAGTFFGGDDIPGASYKAHFAGAYDAAASKSAANVARRRVVTTNGNGEEATEESQEDSRVRLTIARHLMAKLGYSQEELDHLGLDVLRMQGVGSPFRSAALESGEHVLDLGSGFGGDALLAAAKVGSSGSVVGVDLSAAEVQQAAARASERGVGERCRFLRADMEALPLPEASIDVVISNGGFCLCPSKVAAFREVRRVLKPGGRFAISCTVLRGPLPELQDKEWPPCMEVFAEIESLRALLLDLGFSALRVDDADSRMDVWELGNSDLERVAEGLNAQKSGPMGCSHAQKAAARGKARSSVEAFLASDREAGVHWGNPAFEHLKDFDMSALCARVVISAEKPFRD